MKYFLPVIIFAALFFGYSYQKEHKNNPAKEKSVSLKKQNLNKPDTIEQRTDSTILFNDPAYKVYITIKDQYNENKPNSTLKLLYHHKLVFKDTLTCEFSVFHFDFSDMNNDGVKDLLLLNYSSARSNESFHLYLVNSKSKTLLRIKGFEKILNADLDTKNNIINGSALWGNSETNTFYRINSSNELIDLGHSFDAVVGSDESSIKLEKAYKKITQKWGRK